MFVVSEWRPSSSSSKWIWVAVPDKLRPGSPSYKCNFDVQCSLHLIAMAIYGICLLAFTKSICCLKDKKSVREMSRSRTAQSSAKALKSLIHLDTWSCSVVHWLATYFQVHFIVQAGRTKWNSDMLRSKESSNFFGCRTISSSPRHCMPMENWEGNRCFQRVDHGLLLTTANGRTFHHVTGLVKDI